LFLISTTFDFFFFSSFIIGYSFRLLSSISGGNCSLTPKWVPLRFLPAFLMIVCLICALLYYMYFFCFLLLFYVCLIDDLKAQCVICIAMYRL
jgi:hypothetical protein